MADFRKMTPFRRLSIPDVKNYREYKPLLRQDFYERCGYCGDHDFFRETFYEVDHFIPKTLDANKLKDYSNLVYSCRLCNNSKHNKWPTKDKNIPNDGLKGFVDPCDLAYATHFERLNDGTIHAITPLGTWMWKNLSLSNPSHRIKWLLEQLRIELRKLDAIEIEDVDELKRIKELNATYRNYEEALKEIPSFS